MPAPKIRKPIFLLNLASLVLVPFREITVIIVLWASYRGIGQYFLFAEAQYPGSTWSLIIMGLICAPFIYTCIMASLILQVRVVFAAEPRTQAIFTVIGTVAAVVEIGFILPWVVANIKLQFNPNENLPLWLYNTLRTYFVAFVGISCLAFLSQLGITIYRRQKMGMNVHQSLFLLAFKEVCVLIIQCASYIGIGQTFIGAFAQYPNSTWTPGILSGILAIPIYACIMVSLILQVRAVFAAEPRTRFVFTLIGAIAAVVLIGMIIPWIVFEIEVLLFERYTVPLWLYKAYRIYFVAFVGIACLVFLYKLGFTIYRRRKMVIFYICDLTVTEYHFINFDSLGQVFLVCSLPLSSLWASAEVRDHGPVNHSVGSDGSSSGYHSQGKFSFWSQDRKSKDNISDVEKAPSYITDRTHTNEGIQLHPT